MNQLPRPVTTADAYLKEILGELRALRADVGELQDQLHAWRKAMEQPQPPATVGLAGPLVAASSSTVVETAAASTVGNEVEVRWSPVEATPLPADFPGREHLTAAGIVVLESVPRELAALTALPGIGKVTAGRILEALS